METIYWTKIEKIFDTEKEIWISTGKYETIKEEEQGYVPDGDGFQVNMNGIPYEEYLEDPSKYEIIAGKLIFKEEVPDIEEIDIEEIEVEEEVL